MDQPKINQSLGYTRCGKYKEKKRRDNGDKVSTTKFKPKIKKRMITKSYTYAIILLSACFFPASASCKSRLNLSVSFSNCTKCDFSNEDSSSVSFNDVSCLFGGDCEGFRR